MRLESFLLLKPLQKKMLCLSVGGGDVNSVLRQDRDLSARLRYPAATKWTPSFAVTFFMSDSLVFVLAVVAQLVVQQASRTLKFFIPADTNIFI